jgi:hypothetical protein
MGIGMNSRKGIGNKTGIELPVTDEVSILKAEFIFHLFTFAKKFPT